MSEASSGVATSAGCSGVPFADDTFTSLTVAVSAAVALSEPSGESDSEPDDESVDDDVSLLESEDELLEVSSTGAESGTSTGA